MLACRNEERVCRALWPNGFPDSLGGDYYCHILVYVLLHNGIKSNSIILFQPTRLSVHVPYVQCLTTGMLHWFFIFIDQGASLDYCYR